MTWHDVHASLQSVGIMFSKLGHDVSFRAIGLDVLVVRFEDGAVATIELPKDGPLSFDAVEAAIATRSRR